MSYVLCYVVSWKVFVPASLGFGLSLGALDCPTSSASSFGTGGPSCTVTEEPSETVAADGSQDLYQVVTVTNLAASAFFYPITFTITNPDVAMVVAPELIKCESYVDDGTGAESTYETFWMGSSIIISAKLCDQEPLLSGYSTTVGSTSAVTIDYELCSEFPTDAIFVLQLPKLNSPYDAFGAGTLSSMVPAGIGSSSGSITAGGQIYAASLQRVPD